MSPVRIVRFALSPMLLCLSAACSTPTPQSTSLERTEATSTTAETVPKEESKQEYSLVPQSEPVFDEKTVLKNTVHFHKWMETHHARLASDSTERRKAERERLYYLIDSRGKHISQREGKWTLPANDPVLPLLFHWVDELGAYGGELLVKATQPSKYAKTRSHSKMALPDYLNLSLQDGWFDLSSRSTWSVRYPYTFMFWRAGSGKSKKGWPMEHVVISTGAAADVGAQGFSQATIHMINVRADDPSALEDVLALYGMNDQTARSVKRVDAYTSYYAFDTVASMHKEVLSIPLNNGSLFVAFTGLDGTYQWNRPHFIDFVRNISIGGG